jgi:hypothetical protein
MPQAGLEHVKPANERSQTHDLDRAATEIGYFRFYNCKCSYGYFATLITKVTDPGVLLRLRESARSVLL